MFKIFAKKNTARSGQIKTKNGVIDTPFFMPIATKGTVKNIMPEELREIGAQIILGNTYHLWLRPGDKLIARAKGLHSFIHWNQPILTDSGGFQVFSLGARAQRNFGKNGVKITDEGVEFSDPKNGQKYFMSPEKSIEIQLNLGSDIIMVLDECPAFSATYEEVKASVERTTIWAKRCFKYFNQEIKKHKARYKNGKPLLFAIVQGGVYEDLRKKSAQQLLNIDFLALGGLATGWDGYAIGGVAVGEPREKMAEILKWVLPMLPSNKPRYLMGLGRPEEIVSAVLAGVDMFDCVIPTREGRHGRIFLRRKKIDLDFLDKKNKKSVLFYKTININNEKFKTDFTPVDKQCHCVLCRNYSKAYLRHLFVVKEPLALRLASLHNLNFYLDLMAELREKIELGLETLDRKK